MRVLVAGRHAKALAIAASAADAARAAKASDESGNDLKIETAATKAASIALLERAEFDLVIACETLGDGSGLDVLSYIAANTPNTLRIFAARPATLNLLKGELGLFGLFRTLPYPINFRKLWAALNLARSCYVEVESRKSGVRPAAKPQQVADARPAASPPCPAPRIPESEAFKRARAKRNAAMLEANSDFGSTQSSRAMRQAFEGTNGGKRRQEPAMTNASLARLAQLTTIHRPTYDSRGTPAGRNRAAFFVGSGVFAVATAAVLTFFILNANNSIVRSPLALVAASDRPGSDKVIPWQQTAQPPDPVKFAGSEASPSAPDLDVQAKVESESENSAVEPGHPGPPQPNPAPPPSEPPSLESLPATPADEE